MKLIRIDEGNRLYAFKSGDCHTTMGFDYAFKRAKQVSEWLGSAVQVHPENVGTERGFEEYAKAMDAGRAHHQATKQRCDGELDQRFHQFHKSGERVEVTWKDGFEDYTGYGLRTEGKKTRFYVGKSSGWLPIYLTIYRKDSISGGSICSTGVKSVRGLGIFKRG